MNSPTAIQTFTGIFFDPFDPRPEDIRIVDIAHALSLQCRFSGHVRKRWSVAQHSLMVADLCQGKRLKLAALLHDASEAYLVDLPRPIKRAKGMEQYREIELDVEACIALRFGLDMGMHPEVKKADNLMLWAEAEALLHGTSEWTADRPVDLDTDQFAQLVSAIRSACPPSDEYIRDEFLRTFNALGGK
jgi:hypothetical protein